MPLSFEAFFPLLLDLDSRGNSTLKANSRGMIAQAS